MMKKMGINLTNDQAGQVIELINSKGDIHKLRFTEIES